MGRGLPALERLTAVFYDKVRADPLLAPVFAEMDVHHPQSVARFLAEVSAGPRFTPRSGAVTLTCCASTLSAT